MWFFDDDRFGIKDEAFVDGADTLITDVVKSLRIKKEVDGVYRVPLWFSDKPIEGNHFILTRTALASDFGCGFTVYKLTSWPANVLTEVTLVGLCPTLLVYFSEAPDHLYVKMGE